MQNGRTLRWEADLQCLLPFTSNLLFRILELGSQVSAEESGETAKAGDVGSSVPQDAGGQQHSHKQLRILPVPLALTYNACNLLHEEIIKTNSNVFKLEMQGSRRLPRKTDTTLIEITRAKTSIGGNSFSDRAAGVWNCLPSNIRAIPEHSSNGN